MGKVSLGMAGQWAKDYREAADHYTTKIGGLPDWPLPDLDIRSYLLKCRQCGSDLCLVSQVHAPISSDTMKNEERTIYIFGCTKQKCGSDPLSWRAIRVQKHKEAIRSANAEVTLVEASFETVLNEKLLEDDLQMQECGEAANDGKFDDLDMKELGRALSEAAALASHSKKKKKPNRRIQPIMAVSPVKVVAKVVDANIPVLPCFYIFFQEELSSAVCSNYYSLSINERENDLDDQREEETWAEESYEYDGTLGITLVDRTFLKFKKRMDSYPNQCFRYSYGGKPLLVKKELKVPEKCGSCGSTRHYEMQLVPPLLVFLREGSDSSTQSPEEWNWTTLIVYTCSKSCCQPMHQQESSSKIWTVAEEAIIVQLD